MRRSEYSSDDPAEFDFIAGQAMVGYLGILTSDGYPRVVPVNFVAKGQIIYIHGAVAGEKYEAIKANPRVTFSVDIPYSVIPSYWISGENARGATMLYKSILIKGKAQSVENNQEKCAALQSLMEKYQPEGRFLPIDPDQPEYENMLKITAVYRINPEKITVKNNFPSQKTRDFKANLIKNLRERGEKIDLKTAKELEKLCE